ncbi:MAG: alpha/beta hydrolase [Flavobacterium sp.]|nr:alpha/beta hydrolase [Flavobacterium sp.]
MKKIYFLFLFINYFAFAQITIKITSFPSNTPADATIYFASSINNWSPNNSNYIMQSDGLGNKQIVIPQGTGTVSYKFTRGSWATVEKDANGNEIADRTFTFTSQPQTFNLSVLSWADLSGNTGTSTAAGNVQIMNAAFYMPQLDRNRRIWLYLPPDYNTTTKHYPVLYMQDGQNLFDATTSFSGEWQVDETLNSLFAQGDYGAIVVGIDNGGAERLNEYSPWINPSYGGGDGIDYMAFVANTLKPYIDANYRTKPEPAFNALLGSSMGALISTYGAVEYPNVFKKVGSFSAAYWFALSDLNTYINAGNAVLANHRMYFVAGQNEYSTIMTDINGVKNNLQLKGLMATNTLVKYDSYGTHTESYWRGEFATAYQWLFANENLATITTTLVKPTIFQTYSGKIVVNGLEKETIFEIYSVLGQLQSILKVNNGEFYLPENLAKGLYILRNKELLIDVIKVLKR